MADIVKRLPNIEITSDEESDAEDKISAVHSDTATATPPTDAMQSVPVNDADA